jgi:hypothetical protein
MTIINLLHRIINVLILYYKHKYLPYTNYINSCSPTPYGLITGKWKSIDGSGAIEFLKEGSVVICFDN